MILLFTKVIARVSYFLNTTWWLLVINQPFKLRRACLLSVNSAACAPVPRFCQKAFTLFWTSASYTKGPRFLWRDDEVCHQLPLLRAIPPSNDTTQVASPMFILAARKENKHAPILSRERNVQFSLFSLLVIFLVRFKWTWWCVRNNNSSLQPRRIHNT